jgi:hypothetical protein
MTTAETRESPVPTAARTRRDLVRLRVAAPRASGGAGRTLPAFSVSHVPRARGLLRSSPWWCERSTRAPRACGTARARPRAQARRAGAPGAGAGGPGACSAGVRTSGRRPSCRARPRKPPRSRPGRRWAHVLAEGPAGSGRLGHVSRRYVQTVTGRQTSPPDEPAATGRDRHVGPRHTSAHRGVVLRPPRSAGTGHGTGRSDPSPDIRAHVAQLIQALREAPDVRRTGHPGYVACGHTGRSVCGRSGIRQGVRPPDDDRFPIELGLGY